MPFISLSKQPWEEDPDNRRSAGRVPVSGARVELGQIINLSLTGAKVASKVSLPVGTRMRLRVSNDDLAVNVVGEVVWCRRTGWFRFQLGLAFRDVNPEDARKLTQLCTACRDRLVMAQEPVDGG